MEPDQSKTALPSAAIAALHQGNKIEAIKLVRKEHGLDTACRVARQKRHAPYFAAGGKPHGRP